MSELALARFEVTRFFRKRANARDVVLIAGFLFVVLAIAGGVAAWAIQTILGEMSGHSRDARIALGALERARYVLLMIEAFSLVAMALSLSSKTITEEVERASLPLLLQTPIPLHRLLLGKLLGVALVLLILHSVYLTILMLPTPFMRRPPWAVFIEFGAIWLFAVSFLPDGAAEGLAKLNKGRKQMLTRLATLTRWAVLPLLLQAAIPLAARQKGINVWDVLASFWRSQFWLAPSEHVGVETISPTMLTVIVLGWMVFSSLIMWVLLIRGRTR